MDKLAQVTAVRTFMDRIGATSLAVMPVVTGPEYHAWIDTAHTQPVVVCYQRHDPASPHTAAAIPMPAAWRTALAAQWPITDHTTEDGSPCVWVGVQDAN